MLYIRLIQNKFISYALALQITSLQGMLSVDCEGFITLFLGLPN